MKNRKGFTLVELIAVIVILIVLLVIVVIMVNKQVEKSTIKAFLEEANTFKRGAVQKEQVDRTTEDVSDDIFHDQIYGKRCYSITNDILNKYVSKTTNKYFGSVEVCYGPDCTYQAKIWITDGTRYIDGLVNVEDESDISTSFSTEYPESCGVKAIGGGTSGDLVEAHFDYTGGEQVLDILFDGVYSFEVWGAQGGNWGATYYGGYGAYAYGEVELKKGDKLYINVGQQGSRICPDQDDCYPAYNGGARGGKYITGGGGATSIAIKSGQLYNVSDNYVYIIAAGGSGASGGGGDCVFNGAHGGGYSTYVQTGACYSAYSNSGKFGLYGGIPASRTDYRGHGGGYGTGNYNMSYGTGPSTYGWGRVTSGTSFIGNPKIKNGVMYCYDCGNNNTASTKTITLAEYSEEPISHYSKMGNGYAIVKYIENFTDNQ